jgi:hypothetical protein
MRYVYIAGIAVLVGAYILTTSSTEELISNDIVVEDKSKSLKEEKKEIAISFDNKEIKKSETSKDEGSVKNEGLSKVAQILQKKKDELQNKEEVLKTEKEETSVEEPIKEVMSKEEKVNETIYEKNLMEYTQGGYIGGESKHLVYTNFDPDEIETNPDVPPPIPVVIRGTDLKGIPFQVAVDANMYKYAKANNKSIYIGIKNVDQVVEDLIPVNIGSTENEQKISELPPSPGSN